MTRYTVVRQHLGDRMYMPGDTRDAAQVDVTHLLANGILIEEKAEKPVRNKAEQASPKNKAI